MSMLEALLGRSNPSSLALELAVVGLPQAGKTSFLSALYGTPYGRLKGSVTWTVDADQVSRNYLREAWSKLENAEEVPATLPQSEHPAISLVLRREERGRGTHTLAMNCIDTAGEFVRAGTREGPKWDKVAERIRSAHVLQLAVDAMNVIHSKKGDRQAQANFGSLKDMLFDACQTPGPTRVPLAQKALAVCFCKCDAQDVVRIDGYQDDRDARELAGHLIHGPVQQELEKRFRHVGYFAISVLQDRWRWNRAGQCVRVGPDAIEPVGLFEPYEWVCQGFAPRP